MTRLLFTLTLLAGLLLTGVPAQTQTALNTTTLSAAISATTTSFLVASTTNITANTNGLFLPATGEFMTVTAVPVSGRVNVIRGAGGVPAAPAAASATVVITTSQSSVGRRLEGPCTRGTGDAAVLPRVFLSEGTLFVCLTATGAWTEYDVRPRVQGSAPVPISGS